MVDLGSANGTKLNGAPIERARLSPGDVISVGSTSLRYQAASESDDDLDLTCIDTDAQLETTLTETAIPNELTEAAHSAARHPFAHADLGGASRCRFRHHRPPRR